MLDVSAIQTLVASQETTELLQRLVRIDTCNPPGSEEPAAELLAAFMEAAGMETTLMRLAPGRANVVGRWAGTGALPALLQNAGELLRLLDRSEAVGNERQVDPVGAATEVSNPLRGEFAPGFGCGEWKSDRKQDTHSAKSG